MYYRDYSVDKYEKGGKMADGGEIGEVNTEVSTIKRNIMGTTDIMLKIKGMKKPQEFIVYPISSEQSGKPIMIQSSTRIGYLDLKSGKGLMSQSHTNGAYGYHFSNDKKVPFRISEIDLQRIKEHIQSTAGSKVGSSVVFSDNTGAGMMAKGGGVDTLSKNGRKVFNEMKRKKQDRYYIDARRVGFFAKDMKITLSEKEMNDVADLYVSTSGMMEHGGMMAKGGVLSKFNPMDLVGKSIVLDDMKYGVKGSGRIKEVDVIDDDNIQITYSDVASDRMITPKGFSKEELYKLTKVKLIERNRNKSRIYQS
jgi:hypothetical protein